MTLPDFDKAVGSSFGLEIDGVQIKNVQEVSGLKMEQDVIELKQLGNDGRYAIKKLSGGLRAGELTLTRGLTEDKSFEAWIKDASGGKMDDARKDGAITVFDAKGNPVKRYKLSNIWPKSLEVTTMRSGDTSILTEKLMVTYELIEPE